MYSDIEARKDDIDRLCGRYGVTRLELFGSALRAEFDPERSDIDFLVSFRDMPAQEYVDAYFGLKESLENLFHRPVDLLTESGLNNPWMRRQIEREHSVLYAA